MKMKMLLIALGVFTLSSWALEYKILTTVESIVPMGIGRSRIIESKEKVTAEDKAQHHTKDSKDKNKASRDDVKIEEYDETTLLNFYSGVGINFQNIASNDALVAEKITELSSEGWVLVFVTSAVESDAGEKDGKGIFITRYIFKR
ncbi:MAG: hypothetical protein JXR60_00795 [Bacteroidales bacterium]|nr:hypothetical protein [Bacteroidales bacterium]